MKLENQPGNEAKDKKDYNSRHARNYPAKVLETLEQSDIVFGSSIPSPADDPDFGPEVDRIENMEMPVHDPVVEVDNFVEVEEVIHPVEPEPTVTEPVETEMMDEHEGYHYHEGYGWEKNH